MPGNTQMYSELHKAIVLKSSMTNRIQIDNDILSDANLFQESYIKAIKIFANIFQVIREPYDLKSATADNPVDFNNIISFIGRRGVGKSSVMINFAKSLGQMNMSGICMNMGVPVPQAATLPNISAMISNTYFKTLDIIDPTLLGENEKLVESVSGAIYKSFVQQLAQYNNDKIAETIEYRKLVEAFNRLHKCVASVRKAQKGEFDEYNSGSIRSFETISAGTGLKDAFGDLVSRFLSFSQYADKNDSADRPDRSKKQHGCLVIPIDDMDLLTSNIFEYSEEIKKFMRVRQAIILINFDLDKFSQNLLNHYLKTNEKLNLYAQNIDNLDLRLKVQEQLNVVTEYLDKLFPIDHRVVLPTPETFPIDCEYNYYGSNPDGSMEKPVLTAAGIESFIYIPLFAFIRIRYAFKGRARVFLPHTLRELHNYMKMLFEETNGSFLADDKCGSVYNWFASDIIFRWGKENLTHPQFQFLVNFWGLSDKVKIQTAFEFYQSLEETLKMPVENGLSYNYDYLGLNEERRKHNLERYLNWSEKGQPSIGDMIYVAQYFSERDLVQEGKWDQFSFALFSLISLRLKFLMLKKEQELKNKVKKDQQEPKKQQAANKRIEQIDSQIDCYITKESGYFGYSSLKLLNSFSQPYKKWEQDLSAEMLMSAYTNIQIGRIEYRKSHEDFIDISGLFEETGVYAVKQFIALFFFLKLDNYDIASRRICLKDDGYMPLYPSQGIEDPDEDEEIERIGLTGFTWLTFDILNPCEYAADYPVIIGGLREKLINFTLYDKNNKLIVNKDEFLTVLKKAFTEFENAMSNWWKDRLTPVPLYDIVFMSDLISHLETRSRNMTPVSYPKEDTFIERAKAAGMDANKVYREITDQKYKQIIGVIPGLYNEIQIYLRSQDEMLFNYTGMFLYDTRMPKIKHISDVFAECPLIKIIMNDEGGLYLTCLANLIKELLMNRVNRNLRMALSYETGDDIITRRHRINPQKPKEDTDPEPADEMKTPKDPAAHV